jgi:hypothetical protein
VLLALAVLVLLGLLLWELDLARVWGALARADWGLVALAALLNLTVNLWARVKRWQASLEPLPRPGRGASLRELCVILLASYAASNVLPAQAGEALRTVQLHRRHGYAVGALVASRLFEKIVEALSLALVALPVLLFASLPGAAALPLLALTGMGLVGIGLVVLAARRGGRVEPPVAEAEPPRGLSPAALRVRFRRFLSRLSEAMHLLHTARTWSLAMAWSCLSDLVDALMIGLCLLAVGLSAGVPAWFVVLLAVNLAIAVPSTPGQIGVLEAAAVLALGAMGADHGEALAFALLYHACHVLPTTLCGLVGLRGALARSPGG